jgi:hypothetical protein
MRSTLTLLLIVASTLATAGYQYPNVPVVHPGQNAKPVSPLCPSGCGPYGPLRNDPGH